MKSFLHNVVWLFIAALFINNALAEQAVVVEADIDNPTTYYTPHGNQHYPTTVFWGDTHVHTNLSLDAASWGKNERLSPKDAYRFAKGEVVVAHNGLKANYSVLWIL